MPQAFGTPRSNPGTPPFASLWALLTVPIAAACGGEDQPEPDPFISTESPATALTEFDYGDLEPSEVRLNLKWTRNKVSRHFDPEKEPVRLTGIHIASMVPPESTEPSAGFDRITFSFAPEIPGYRLVLANEGGGCDASGDATSAPAQLVVDFEPAQAEGDGNAWVEDQAPDGLPALSVAAQTCNEAGRVRWLLGLSTETDFRIMETSGEPRLVLDLRHPSG